MSGATACAKVPNTSVKDFVETVLWKNCLCPGVKPVSIFDLLVRLERPLAGHEISTSMSCPYLSPFSIFFDKLTFVGYHFNLGKFHWERPFQRYLTYTNRTANKKDYSELCIFAQQFFAICRRTRAPRKKVHIYELVQPTETENFDHEQKIASCPRKGAIANYSFFAQQFFAICRRTRARRKKVHMSDFVKTTEAENFVH